MYPSVSGTPSSLATSNLKRSKAPLASGTTALLEEEFVFDMIHFLLGYFCLVGCYDVIMWSNKNNTLEVYS